MEIYIIGKDVRKKDKNKKTDTNSTSEENIRKQKRLYPVYTMKQTRSTHEALVKQA